MTYQDKRCQWNKKLHVHVSLLGTQSLSSIDNESLCIWPYVDKRADARYISTEADCLDTDYLVYFIEHYHLLNIDPNKP
jgi:hypothetical protein